MLWRGVYNHGQIKLALKATGRPMTGKEAGLVT
jgi:hypothetical protein